MLDPKKWKDRYKNPLKLVKIPFDAFNIGKTGREAIRDASREAMRELEREAKKIRSQPSSTKNQKRLWEIRQSRRRLEEQLRRSK
jgi:hypothetical protein